MKDSFYFTHDFNAHDDLKIKSMMRVHGMKGYGIFWYLIEILAAETERWYLARDYDGLAYDIRESSETIKSIVEDFGLFVFDDDNFWNKRLDKHFDLMAEKSEKAKINIQKRWEKQAKSSQNQYDRNTTVLRNSYDRNTINEMKGNEMKEDKTKEKVEKEKKVFIKPTQEEAKEYFIELGEQEIEALKFLDFYESKGWIVGSNKMKDWKSAVRNWCRRKRENPTNQKISLPDFNFLTKK